VGGRNGTKKCRYHRTLKEGRKFLYYSHRGGNPEGGAFPERMQGEKDGRGRDLLRTALRWGIVNKKGPDETLIHGRPCPHDGELRKPAIPLRGPLFRERADHLSREKERKTRRSEVLMITR